MKRKLDPVLIFSLGVLLGLFIAELMHDLI